MHKNLNLNVRSLEQSATLRINERSRELLRQGKTVYRFGLGQSPFPVPDVVVEALRQNAHQKDYLPVCGLPELRQAVAEHHQQAGLHQFSGDDILIGPGTKELMFLLQLSYYGELLIPTPSWVSYAPQAQIIGRNVRWIRTRRVNNCKLTPEELTGVCRSDPDRPRILILNYPSNPTGCCYSSAELQALAAVCEEYGIVALSDEIYMGVHYRGVYASIAQFYPEGTIVSTGLSKWCGAGGWRLGTFAFPKSLRWLLDAMAVVASETYTSTAAPIQYAAVVAYQGGPEIDSYLLNSRKVLRANAKASITELRAAGINVFKPDGGFYLFPDFTELSDRLSPKGVYDGLSLVERALADTGVALLPGSDFGRPAAELTARLAFIDFDGAHALRAAAKIEDEILDDAFVAHVAPHLLEGIRRLARWAASS
ncbi:MAG: aminotransferase class I/II-fold pyridoxal phosphate-dependent enzyme [Bdellovibrionales bacterium]|nr:aminotransferase class I/II-fold pyridoxal phosphate-dependent enzyme [Bdellovibrionales bacterium]